MNALAQVSMRRSKLPGLGWAAAMPNAVHSPRGCALAEEGLRIAETVEHPFSLINACHGISACVSAPGGPAAGHPGAGAGHGRLCQDWHIPLAVPGEAAALGLAYALDGRVAEGLALAETWGSRKRSPYGRGRDFSLAHLSEAYLPGR